MNIIAIAGQSGAGKNTVAALLAAELVNQAFSVKIDSLAAPVKARLRMMYRLLWLDKEKWRGALQADVTASMQADSLFLLKWIFSRNNIDPRLDYPDPAAFLIITDIRRPVEAEYCRARGGVVWLVESQTRRRNLPPEQADHESETSVALIAADHVLTNDVPMPQLARHITELVRQGKHWRNG